MLQFIYTFFPSFFVFVLTVVVVRADSNVRKKELFPSTAKCGSSAHAHT